MKNSENMQKRLSGRCEMLFQQEVRERCVRCGQYSDNVIRSVASAVFPVFVRKCFRCRDDRDFLCFNADTIQELVRKCLARNLTHFRYRDRRWKRGAAALCRKPAQADFVLIGVGHKYTRYKPSIEEAVNAEFAVSLAG